MSKYLPDPVGQSAQGHPIYILVEDDGTRRYVVSKPEGAFYCDANGNVVSASPGRAGAWAGLLIGGALGALLGPWGAVAGAAAGAALGEVAEKAKNNA